jgi:hypothetical protein
MKVRSVLFTEVTHYPPNDLERHINHWLFRLKRTKILSLATVSTYNGGRKMNYHAEILYTTSPEIHAYVLETDSVEATSRMTGSGLGSGYDVLQVVGHSTLYWPVWNGECLYPNFQAMFFRILEVHPYKRDA